jgi:copper chaperone CopZ
MDCAYSFLAALNTQKGPLMKSRFRNGAAERLFSAEDCSDHSPREVRPTAAALGEPTLGHTRTVFTVEGMTCGGCANRIIDALANLQGVSNASVGFEARQATIDFDPGRTDFQAIETAVNASGYAIETDDGSGASVTKEPLGSGEFRVKPYVYGLMAGVVAIAFYLSLVTLTSDWVNARFQFAEYRWWIIGLAAGLGIQVTLYATSRRRLSSRALQGAGAGVAASGGMSATAMAICCSHYLVTLLPIIGLPFLSAAAASLEQYQVQFFAAGVIFNLIGIAMMLQKYRRHNIPPVAVFN